MLLLALALIATAIGVGIYTVASSADEKATVRASLRQLDGYEVDSVRDQELLAPMKDRTIAPLMGKLTAIGNRYTPDGYVEKVRDKLVASGNNSPDAVDRFVAVKVVGVALAPVMIILVFGVTQLVAPVKRWLNTTAPVRLSTCTSACRAEPLLAVRP